MLKTHPFVTNYTLADVLSGFSKAELRSFGAMVGCHLAANLKKQDAVRTFADYLKSHVSELLWRCSAWEVSCIRDLAEAGPGVAVAVSARTPVSPVEIILGFRMQMDQEQGIRWTAMADELREAVGGLAAGLLSDPAFLVRSERMQALRGLLVLYGYAPLDLLMDQMSAFYPEADDETLLGLLFQPEFLCGLNPEEMLRGKEGESILMVGSQVRGVFDDEADFFRQIRRGIDYKLFTKEQALLAGRLPLPEFGLAVERKLKQVFRKTGGLTAREAENLMFDLWIDKQDFGAPPTSYIDLVKDRVTFHSVEEIQTVMDAVGDYINAVPCWALLGNASNEIRSKTPLTRPPRIQIGPNMRKAGVREEDVQAAMDAAFYSDVADSMLFKAGRNDPCPCGSGLKFKNCHGKGS